MSTDVHVLSNTCVTVCRIFALENQLINKQLKQQTRQIYKTDFKNCQIKRKKTPGWEADVSLPFLMVHFPKNLRSASIFLTV